MNTPLKLLTIRLAEINTQLKICIENRCDVEAVEIEKLLYQNAIKILKEFGMPKKGITVELRKRKALQRRRYLKYRHAQLKIA